MTTPKECQICGGENFRYFERTRQGVKYSVHVCSRCHNIARREIEDANSDNDSAASELIMRRKHNVNGSSDSK